MLRLIFAAVLLTLCQIVGAQEFIDLTPGQVRIGAPDPDSPEGNSAALPVYTWQRQLGPRYQDSTYTVSIEYPEFVEMTKDEVCRYLEVCGEPLPELPVVRQTVAVARKQGVLEVSFVPLVFREGKYRKLVSFKLNVQSKAVGRAATRGAGGRQSRYADHSVLREGTWAKISVPESGFYQLTDALIRQAGFSDLKKVKVYGYGGALQPERLTGDYLTESDDLTEVPTAEMGGRRVFYAVGPVNWSTAEAPARTRNPYADYGCYFLTENDAEPLTISTEELTEAHYPRPNDYHSLYEVDDFAWYHGGRNLFDKTLLAVGTPHKYTLPAAGTDGTVAVALTYDGPVEATVAVNDSVVGTVVRRSVNLDSYTEAEETVVEYRVEGLLREQNTITITQTSGSNLRLDYIDLRMDTPKPMADLTSEALPVPDFMYQIVNQDHHADEAVDMVILIPTSQKLLGQAERIKEWHETADGLRVRIVPVDELYNEFSSGTPDATAYRRYMKMLYDRAETEADMPRYLMLFGDGAWDNRLKTEVWSDVSADDLLLCFESENSFSHVNCYVSDDFYCLLDDEEEIQVGSSYTGKPDVAVGRYPARTADEAAILVDKTLSYARNEQAGAWQNVVCMMGDDGNNNAHMSTADKVATLVESRYPGYLLKKIYWDAYQRTSSATGYSYPEVTRLIKQQITDGALMMNYCGHGAAYSISHEQVMKRADFEMAASHYPLWVTASCDISPFDGQEENIGETVMLNKRGGGVAFFGTTRTVYTNYNEAMNLAFTGYVLSPDYTIGEAARLAKCDLVDTGRDNSANKLQYTLLGDPALRLACPTAEVVVDSINGRPAGEGVQLAAGSVARVTGHIERGGVRATDYRGVVTATVRDAEETITCKLNDTSKDGASDAFVYNDRTKTLYNGSDSIGSGTFRFTFAVPKDISYTEGSGLMTLYAVNDSQTETAHGISGGFTLTDNEVASNDSIGPSIYCYLNTKTFMNGGNVNSTPYFGAELYDESGINASGSSLGHDLELVIDGEMSKTYNLNDYFTFDFGDYRSGRVDFTIPELPTGQHKLLFRAWDVLNNSSTSQLVFNVVENAGPGDISVVCTKNPATTTTSFIINHQRTGSEMDVVLDVFDMSGRQLVKLQRTGVSTDGSYTMDWDLSVAGGSRLGTGVYIYRVQVTSSGGSSTYANKLIILSNN